MNIDCQMSLSDIYVYIDRADVCMHLPAIFVADEKMSPSFCQFSSDIELGRMSSIETKGVVHI